MKITIGTNIKISEPTKEIQEYCRKKLIIDNPEYLQKVRMNKWIGNTPKSLYLFSIIDGLYVLPYGCLDDILNLSNDNADIIDYDFHDFQNANYQGNISLREYQEKAVNEMLKYPNGILNAPCGSGKTQMGLSLITKLGFKALWLTHTEKLLSQSMERLKTYIKCDMGTITKGKVNIGKDITFATAQTMCKIDPEVYKNEFNVIIVDECHHLVGSPTKVMMFYKILSNCNAQFKYGLSATLNRSDNLITSMYAIIGNVRYKVPKEDVGSYIIKAVHNMYDIDIDYDIERYTDTDGMLDYLKLISMLSEDQRRNKIIIDNIDKCHYVGRKKQLVLCHRVNQCHIIAKELVDKGLSVSEVTGKVLDKNRNYDSEIIVATYSLAKEGLDIPTLDTLHLVTPQKDKTIVTQSVGRVERNISGKLTPVVIDYVDTKIPYCMNCYIKRKRIIKKH